MPTPIKNAHRSIKRKHVNVSPTKAPYRPLQLHTNYTELDYITKDIYTRLRKIEKAVHRATQHKINQERKIEQEIQTLKEELTTPNNIAWQKPINYRTPQTKKKKVLSSSNSPLHSPVIPLPPIINNARSQTTFKELMEHVHNIRQIMGLSRIVEEDGYDNTVINKSKSA
jgi:hypothetical protein